MMLVNEHLTRFVTVMMKSYSDKTVKKMILLGENRIFFFHRLRKTEKLHICDIVSAVCQAIHENLECGAVSGACSRETGTGK